MKKKWIVCLLLLGEVIWIDGLHGILRQKCQFFEKEKQEIHTIDCQVNNDLKYFPIPHNYTNQITMDDTYGASRQNGRHTGCDIMDSYNEAGRIPIISATDGVITNLGWLFLGGYRVGITSDQGIYYYYAHLDSYASGLEVGKKIFAGELIGFMGNTGEGEEGTRNQFDVHLHFGIYYNQRSEEETVNPYPYLLKLLQE